MIRKWITKIVNEVMEETMTEIEDNVDYTNIEDMAAEKAAENTDVNIEQVLEHLDIDAYEIAQQIDTYDVAYNVDKDDLAREFDTEDIASYIDVDGLASSVSERMSDDIEVDLETLAGNISLDSLAQEIDHGMLAKELVENEKLFPVVVKEILATHDKLLSDIVVSLNKIINERLQE
jgi:hypothetical protein